MKTNNWREVFDKAWETSYAKILYGQTGFQTCDLGSPFQVDKDVVKDFIQSLLDEKDKEKQEALDKQKEDTVKSFKDMQERYPEFALDLELFEGEILINTTDFERVNY